MVRKSSLLVAILAMVMAALFSTSGTAFAATVGGAAKVDSPTRIVVIHKQAVHELKQSGIIRNQRASAFFCDTFTHICVKFNKSETRQIANLAPVGVISVTSWAGYLCSKIPIGAAVVGCTIIAGIYAYLLERSFESAASNGKCVELHFPYITGPFWWKTEGC